MSRGRNTRVKESHRALLAHRGVLLCALLLLVSFLAAVPAVTAPAASAATGPEPVWAIGTQDSSDAEFALTPGNYSQYSSRFPNDVQYAIGTSTPGQDWPYVQPGPADPWAGSRAHPFTVTYDLPSVPTGDPQLVVWYLDTNPYNPPTAQVLSNGTKVNTTPLPAGGGGGVYGTTPQVPYALDVQIPAGTLKAGTNTLTIENSQGSWTIYDALELLPPSPPGAPPAISISRATPTSLFANAPGQPQIVNVSVLNTGNPGEVTFTASTNGSTTTTMLNVPSGASDQQVDVVPASAPGPANLAITSSAGGSAQLQLPYQRRWQLYVIHGSHQDIGYDGTPPAMRQLQEQFIDTAVQKCQATANYPADARFHWTFEHAWTLENYLADRTPAQAQAVQACLQSGQFELDGTYDNQLYDLASSEQMARALYAGTRALPGQLGVHVDAAIQDDAPPPTEQDIQLLAKTGISYLMLGIDPTRNPQPENDPALFWWKAPDGKRVLTWYGLHGYGEGFSLGLNNPVSQFPSVVSNVSSLLSNLQSAGYPRDIYPIQTFLDNTAPITTLPDMIKKWDQTYSYPRLIFSTPTPFFHAISSEDPASIPTYSGDWSDWWSDGAGSSAHETAQNRQAQTRTTVAETLGGLSSLTTPAAQTRQESADQAYRQEELYTEHTWGGAGPSFSDPEWPYKQAHAIQADRLSRQALTSAAGDLTGQMQNTSQWPEVAVFNSLSWARSGPVQATVPEGNLGGQAFQLLDAAGHAVPYELISRAGGKITLRFAAADVPSAGYATYQLVPASGLAAAGSDPALHASSTGLENQYFRITLDPATGTIKSVYDKAQGKELLDQAAPFQGNQFIYRPNCAGANKGNACPTSAASQWSPTQGTVKVLSDGPVSATVEVTEDPGAGGATTGISGLTERITLYAGNPRVYISDTVDKARVDTAEEAYFAFPFKVDNPQITYEVPGDSVRFFTDQMPGSALDWQGIQSYADISNAGGGVTFSSPDAPMVEFGHIRTQEFLTRPGHLDGTPDTISPGQYLPEHGWVFSYAYNNLWFTNYRIAQQGSTTFHYAITSHPGGFDPVGDTHAGWGYQTPLVPLAVPAGQHGAYQPGSHSLVSVSQPNVVIQTIKQPYAGGPGLTIRLLEVAGQAGPVSVHLPFQAGTATLDDPTEQPLSSLPTDGNQVQVPVEAHGIVTLTVLPQLALTATAPASTLAGGGPVPAAANRTSDTPLVNIPQLDRGHSIPVTVTLFNNSHQTLSGSLSLPATDGLSISPASAALSQVAPGATAKAVFTVTAPASQPTGQVTLTATADLGPGQATVSPAKLAVNVVNPIDVTASPTPLQLLEAQPTQVTATVTNNLGQATTATVHLTTPSGWAVQPASTTITLGPGQSQTATFTVTPPAGSIGQATLQAIAEGGGATATVSLPATVGKPVAIVGKPGDTSNDQFALAPDHYAGYPSTFPNDVDFTYGTSNPATDWSYIQPGPADIWAGSQSHTFTFRFSLPQAPTSDLTFTGWLLDTQQAIPPTIQIGLNADKLQAIALPPGGGDGYHWGDGEPNLYAGIQPTSFSVTLPAAQLHAGTNAVTITTVSGSWLVYEAFGVWQQPPAP